MSSLEIEELTGKDHKNVMRDIRVMFEALGDTGLRFERSYKDSTGRTLPCYELPYDETMTLITGYSIPLRAAVVRRWRELEEAKPALPNFTDPVAAARAWADERDASSARACLSRAPEHDTGRDTTCVSGAAEGEISHPNDCRGVLGNYFSEFQPGSPHLTTLPQAGEPQTMSSQEIAERTKKDHNHVMRDFRVMCEGLGIDESKFGSIYRDSMNREKPCYRLPKRECMILISGYSVELRAAIIDRWQELEAAQAPRIPTHQEALRLAQTT